MDCDWGAHASCVVAMAPSPGAPGANSANKKFAMARAPSPAREGDYSIHARGASGDNALGEVLLEINSLGETLRVQRLGAFEATALLRTIMGEIDVAVFTFDPERRLRLVNRAGETLLGQPMDKLLGKSAKELGLDPCYDVDEDEPLTLSFPGGSGRWGVRRSTFREKGLPHELLVLKIGRAHV